VSLVLTKIDYGNATLRYWPASLSISPAAVGT